MKSFPVENCKEIQMIQAEVNKKEVSSKIKGIKLGQPELKIAQQKWKKKEDHQIHNSNRKKVCYRT
jgi:hypothetical protein